MRERATASGETVYVADDETERGSKGPFHVVYESAAGTDRWGYLCSNCDSLEASAMDTMGRIVCGECGNTHKPEEWDAVGEA